MERNYFDANDSRNFCSLVKEAKKYSKDNANALRDHYETKGVLSAFLGIGLGLGLPKLAKYMFATPKIEHIVKE